MYRTMGKALYRKYRSRSLDEIVGQDHITSTLKNALKQGRISHAYLLTGPRGVGKTSIARILAHEINGLPYSEEPHLDIIEIDAASNRRIDEMRDLRDRVQSAPASAKYKIYIIDEVHMLTKEAFNALLKTLEEPPAHVIFILATTEAHKLPETIVSRTQRYSFRPVPKDEVVEHLKNIARKEKINIDDDALDLIAEHGEGSFRDSISLLDQASTTNSTITLHDVELLLGRAPNEQIERLATRLDNRDMPGIVADLRELYANGFEAAMIATQLGALVRMQVLEGTTADPARLVVLLHDLLAVPAAHDPKRLLEIQLLKHAYGSAQTNQVKPTETNMPSRVKSAPKATTQETPTSVSVEDFTTSQPTSETSPTVSTAASETASEPASEQRQQRLESDVDIDELWQAVLQQVKQTHNTLYGIARMAKPSLDGDDLTISFKFAFHAKRLKEAKNHAVLTKTLEQLRGRPTQIHYVVADKAEQPTNSTAPDISTISNIFGGAELLE